MRATACCMLLLLLAGSASAQLNSGAYWEQAGLRERGGIRLLSGATLTDVRGAVASAVVAGSAAVPVSGFMLGVHAGALYDLHRMTSAGATLSAVVRTGGNQLEFRAGAAAAPDEHRGTSVTSVAAALSRSGVSLSVRSSVLPPVAGGWRDSIVVERDTTYLLRYIAADRPRRLYTDAEVAYRGEYDRIQFAGAVGYRLGSDGNQPYWARLGASYRVSSTLTVGGSYGRELDTPWLPSQARTTGAIFLRIDAPRRAARERPLRTAPHEPQLFIATSGATTFTITAPAAKTVEVAGTFTDWEPLALQRGAHGTWSVSVPLLPGVYHIALRIDGARWYAPPGLPTVPDEFGGQTGVFEVR
jgi:hypothetical protein